MCQSLSTSAVYESLKEVRPMSGALLIHQGERQQDNAHQQIMQLVLIPYVGPALGPHRLNGGWIYPPGLFQNACRDLPIQGNRASSAFFESSFVEKCIRICVDQFVGKLRWDRGVDSEALDASVLNPTEYSQ